MSNRIRVGVLCGGRSAEHEVSILSARNVARSLDREKFEVFLVGIDRAGRWRLEPDSNVGANAAEVALVGSGPELILEPRPTGAELKVVSNDPTQPSSTLTLDVIFPVLHGPFGEDGTLQGLLELADIAYVGAGVLGSAIGMDKDVQKRLLQQAHVPVAEYVCLRKASFLSDPEAVLASAAAIGLPVFVKPANLGSSVGVTRVSNHEALANAIAHAFDYDLKVLVEREIVGRELECSVMGNDEPVASVPGEIELHHADGFYSYEAKYLDDDGVGLCIPARLTADQTRAVRELAVRTFQTLECRGLARVDLFLGQDGSLVVNEINTMPGFTAISMFSKLWEATGLAASRLVEQIVQLALDHRDSVRTLSTKHVRHSSG